ncbi:Low molecular mass early light-inducible protein HV90 [Scenedesmus sp. PABB004]|nr:Low molecular mass early light-inducible protein HV90 [Scenedesmus sp. PABB004]
MLLSPSPRLAGLRPLADRRADRRAGGALGAAAARPSAAGGRPLALRVRASPEEEGAGPSGAQTTAPPQQPQQPPGEEEPIWVRREREREAAAGRKGELPWPLYLLLSCFVAIASVGSVFEYFGGNPVFGVIQPDSPLWAPVLGLFAFTGLPTAAFLFLKGVNAANEAAEQQDRMDGPATHAAPPTATRCSPRLAAALTMQSAPRASPQRPAAPSHARPARLARGVCPCPWQRPQQQQPAAPPAVPRAAPEARPASPAAVPQPLPSSPPPPPAAPPLPPPGRSFFDVMKFNGPGPELIQSRLAMVGILAAARREAVTGAPLAAQLADTPPAVWAALGLIVYASLVPMLKGARHEAFGVFSPRAELTNGRAAMLGFAVLAALEWRAGVPFF